MYAGLAGWVGQLHKSAAALHSVALARIMREPVAPCCVSVFSYTGCWPHTCVCSAQCVSNPISQCDNDEDSLMSATAKETGFRALPVCVRVCVCSKKVRFWSE